MKVPLTPSQVAEIEAQRAEEAKKAAEAEKAGEETPVEAIDAPPTEKPKPKRKR